MKSIDIKGSSDGKTITAKILEIGEKNSKAGRIRIKLKTEKCGEFWAEYSIYNDYISLEPPKPRKCVSAVYIIDKETIEHLKLLINS